MEKSLNYYDFADDDYYIVKNSIDAESYRSGLCPLMQKICERYFKHLIDKYLNENDYEATKYYHYMRTHSLKSLCLFLEKELEDFKIDKMKIFYLDGFYFSSSYPGENSFKADEETVKECWEVLKYCKHFIDDYLESH